MKFSSYYLSSWGALAALCSYAVYTKEQFYPTILFLTQSKVSYVVVGNMLLANAFFLAGVVKTIFLGTLTDSEIEMLIDRAKYTITETCLALTIFRNELTPPIIGLFGTLLFVKAFHWLARNRVDRLDQTMPSGYSIFIRLIALLAVLLVADVALCYSCVNYIMEHGKSVLILFAFEFGLLVIGLFSTVLRYLLYGIDTYLSSGLASKGLYVMLTDVICDAMRFVIYIFFFCLVFVYYGLPIHIIRELWTSFYLLHKNVTSFIKYLRLTQNLDSRFPNATDDEIEAAGDCLICREPMTSGKKLPCVHVFHLECLRMWLQHQQSCPLCRADIPVNAPVTSGDQAARAQARMGAGQNQDGQVVPPEAQEGRGGEAEAEAEVDPPVEHREGEGEGGLIEAVPAYHAHRRHNQQHDQVHEARSRSVSPAGSAVTSVANSPTLSSHSPSMSPSVPVNAHQELEHWPQAQRSSALQVLLRTPIPSFFIVTAAAAGGALPVYTAPEHSSGVIRTVLEGTVLFCTQLVVEAPERRGAIWLRIPDGWVNYDFADSTHSLSAPSMEPYSLAAEVVDGEQPLSPISYSSLLSPSPSGGGASGGAITGSSSRESRDKDRDRDRDRDRDKERDRDKDRDRDRDSKEGEKKDKEKRGEKGEKKHKDNDKDKVRKETSFDYMPARAMSFGQEQERETETEIEIEASIEDLYAEDDGSRDRERKDKAYKSGGRDRASPSPSFSSDGAFGTYFRGSGEFNANGTQQQRQQYQQYGNSNNSSFSPSPSSPGQASFLSPAVLQRSAHSYTHSPASATSAASGSSTKVLTILALQERMHLLNSSLAAIQSEVQSVTSELSGMVETELNMSNLSDDMSGSGLKGMKSFERDGEGEGQVLLGLQGGSEPLTPRRPQAGAGGGFREFREEMDIDNLPNLKASTETEVEETETETGEEKEKEKEIEKEKSNGNNELSQSQSQELSPREQLRKLREGKFLNNLEGSNDN